MAIHALNRVAYKITVPPLAWKVGQLVWLEGKNLLLPYGTVKLAPRRHGPFKITKIISPVAVRVKLPAQWNIHPVFHTSLLTPYIKTPSHSPNFTQPPPDLIDGEEEYEVEQICAHRCKAPEGFEGLDLSEGFVWRSSECCARRSQLILQ
jgi:hypothetical protein